MRRVFAPLLMLLAGGCGNPPTAAPAAGGSAPSDGGSIVVKVTAPKKQPIRWVIEQPATVQAYESTPVVAKLAGFVGAIGPDTASKVLGAVIDIGSDVSPGQLLATLDIPELREELAEATATAQKVAAELEQAKADVTVADAQVKTAEAMVEEAKASVLKADADVLRWKGELDQTDELVTRKAIDTQTRDVIRKQYQSAVAGKAEAAAKVMTAAAAVKERAARTARAATDVTAAAARLKVAEATVRRVTELNKYTAITSPFAGVVTARMVHTKHHIAAGGVLFVVAKLDPVRVMFDVPEANAAKVTTGAKAGVRVPSLNNRVFDAVVARTAGVIQPDTRTLRAEIDLKNADRVLTPGTYAVVQIPAEVADATVVPAACVLAADETHYAYLVEAGKAVKYRVQVGRTEGTTVQLLGRRKAAAASGPFEAFTGQEAVVVGNLGALADGSPVEVKE